MSEPDDTPTRLPSEQVIEIDEDGNVHYPDELTELRAEVSRLQQENALLRRSLEMLTKQLEEAEREASITTEELQHPRD